VRAKGPSAAHWFGTDLLGRDEFTRVMYGGRISLLVGLSVALSAGIIGAVVGAVAGYYGGWIDNVLMRVTDLFLSIPFLVILIIAANALGGSLFDIVVILAVFFWMPDARIVRGVFLSLKEKEFVESARSSGASNARIIFLHILPNSMGPIIVNMTLSVAAAILTESALSFLGFGIQPPTPTWGNLLNNATGYAQLYPWLVWFPGLAILITVLCVNFLGDGLRDALDPHQKIGPAE
jgi:peptide/nickel transport system permease protein